MDERIVDFIERRIVFHSTVPLKSQVANPDIRNIIDKEASLRELNFILEVLKEKGE